MTKNSQISITSRVIRLYLFWSFAANRYRGRPIDQIASSINHLESMQWALSKRVMSILFATLICCGVFWTAWYRTIPSSLQLNCLEQNSISLSILRHFTFFSVYFSIITFHSVKVENISLLCFRGYTRTFLEKSSIDVRRKWALPLDGTWERPQTSECI